MINYVKNVYSYLEEQEYYTLLVLSQFSIALIFTTLAVAFIKLSLPPWELLRLFLVLSIAPAYATYIYHNKTS